MAEKCWPEGGGAQLATHLVLDLLKGHYDITVLTGTRRPEMVEGARYLRSALLDVGNKVSLWKNVAALSGLATFQRLVGGSDLVYVPGIAYPAVPAARRQGKRVVVHLHDFQPVSYSSVIVGGARANPGAGLSSIAETLRFEMLEDHPLSRALLASAVSPINRLGAACVEQASAVICVSRRQAEIINRCIPGIASKTRVVYNPAPPAPPPIEERRRRCFLFLGGGSGTKGLGVLVRASRRVRVPGKAGLTIAGVGAPAMERVRKICSSSPLRCEVLGRVPYEETWRLYGRSMATLVPSVCEETFSYVVLESMLSGTLPIASRVGGIPEVVSGSPAEGYLFEPGDADRMAEMMDAASDLGPDELDGIGARLRQKALERFDPARVGGSLLEALRGGVAFEERLVPAR